MPQQLAEAEAASELATKQFQRLDALVKDESAPVVKRDEAEMAFKAAQAKVQQVRAGMVAKQAELAAHQSQVRQAEEGVEKATMDLDDCKLIAPFRGEIAAVHGIRGGMVAAGTPVVTLVMMDPLKVEIAVSAEKDRQLNFNDIVTVHVPGFDEPLDGYVYMKSTSADPTTRTFKTTILVRNRRMQVHVPDDPEADKLPRTENLWRLMLEEEGKPGPYFVEVGSLYQDDEGYFVWKAEELTFQQLRADFDPVIRIRKVRVKPGPSRVPLLNVYTFRELVDAGDLNPATDLLASKLPDGLKDGEKVFFARERWVLRPGDLVEVSIDDDNARSGFYVPTKSILQEDDRHFVFAARPNTDGVAKAEKMEVKVFQAVGEFRRIESVEPDQLTEGSQVVLEGAHYLVPGEPVNVYEVREVQP
ncbi:MAG: HlyD family efflux transporter periplasmic adaptor subunit [Planctomycetes bacterium]|nr:HlyD family efflux transporter periplasmic adaptor subunit [Planctomycetota bacterium]